jgi:hypothetical protein
MADPTPPTPPTPGRWAWLAKFVPSNWQAIVAYLAVALITTLANQFFRQGQTPIPVPEPPIPVWTPPPPGWVPPTDDDRRETFRALRVPRFDRTEAGQTVVGDADAPLWRLAAKGRGKGIPVRDQGQLGSCVSFGFSAALEYTMAAQVALSKQRQDLPDSCQEAIYGGSRVNVNGGRVPFSGDGSTGSWAAKWLETTGGMLARGTYGSLNLSTYDINRCRAWGDRGVPAELAAEYKKHAARCTQVQTADEAKTALAQGYAIGICSDVGFQSMTRDAQGFIRASGSWGHCMAVIGYRADRPGFLILNSWGADWVKGPKGTYADIPDGSFWADATTVERMLRQQDSFAVANADGFRAESFGPRTGSWPPPPGGRWTTSSPVESAMVCARSVMRPS